MREKHGTWNKETYLKLEGAEDSVPCTQPCLGCLDLDHSFWRSLSHSKDGQQYVRLWRINSGVNNPIYPEDAIVELTTSLPDAIVMVVAQMVCRDLQWSTAIRKLLVDSALIWRHQRQSCQ